ncbi:hypothetical protein FQN51_009568 [Onygenales sp. PD_10]|nr:hypothetical protein FQN51_009568 [Onygenales sp. PD_10]
MASESTPPPTTTTTQPTQTDPTPIPAQIQSQMQLHARTQRLPILTYHCAFCNHLLLASTRDLTQLPRRREPAVDRALILPLPNVEDEDVDEEDGDGDVEKGNQKAGGDGDGNLSTGQKQEQKHYTILLSTTTPDRKPTMIRRADGFEKRLLFRCGRCRVVVGYALDEVHFAFADKDKGEGVEGGAGGVGDGEGDGEEGGVSGRSRSRKIAEEVVYLLPGAMVETGEMGREKKGKEEWVGWEGLGGGGGAGRK